MSDILKILAWIGVAIAVLVLVLYAIGITVRIQRDMANDEWSNTYVAERVCTRAWLENRAIGESMLPDEEFTIQCRQSHEYLTELGERQADDPNFVGYFARANEDYARSAAEVPRKLRGE